jgi:hypothetical protein
VSNAIFLRPLPFTVNSATNTVAGTSKDYLANDHMGVVWQGQHPASASQHFIIDLGADTDFDTIALIGLTGSTTSWTIQVSVADAAAGPTFVAGGYDYAAVLLLAGAAMPAGGRGRSYWEKPAGGPSLVRYVRVNIAAVAAGTTITVARLVIGKRIRPTRNFDFGAGAGVRDTGKVDWSARGVFLRRRGAKLRALGLSFNALHRDEVEESVNPLIEQVGSTGPILLVRDPDAHAQRQRRIYFGPMVGDLGTIQARADGFQWKCDVVDLEAFAGDA